MTTPPDAPSWGSIPPVALVPLRTHARHPMAAGDWTSVRPLLRPVAGWSMDHAHFEFDASFIVPSARDELANLTTLVRRHPHSPLSVFAHADPTGSDEYNKPLSGRRALAVYGMLIRDVGLWERLYTSPMSGDRWGERAIQRMLSVLTDAQGEPYYAGRVDDYWGSQSTQALERYQADHVDPQGHPLQVDGQLGPLSRKSIARAYMDWLCTRDDGEVLAPTPERFLAQGADPNRRGDVQGCSELNPRVVFSQAEHARYQAPQHKTERDEDNAENRRAVVFLYPPGVQVDPSWWPCPAAESGLDRCRKRLWSDAHSRRSPQAERRHFDGDRNTFGCRFYHYLGLNTQAETPVTLGHTFDVYLHRQFGHGTPRGTLSLTSTDGEIDQRQPASAALLISAPDDREVRCLSFTGLPRGKRYTLSYQPAEAGDAFEPVVLMGEFMLEDFSGDDAEHDAEQVPYVVSRDDSHLHYEPVAGDDTPLALREPDREGWEVDKTTIDWDGMKVEFTTLTMPDSPPPIEDEEDEDDG